MTNPVTLTIELDRETDGRWIADVQETPGAMAYGDSPRAAITAAMALALHVLADQLQEGALDLGAVETGPPNLAWRIIPVDLLAGQQGQ